MILISTSTINTEKNPRYAIYMYILVGVGERRGGKKGKLILLRDSWPFRRPCWVLRRLQYWKIQKLYHPEKSDILRLFFRMKQVSQVVKSVTPLLQTVAIPPSARHPSIWHKPLKPIPHHREWTSKWPLLASCLPAQIHRANVTLPMSKTPQYSPQTI